MMRDNAQLLSDAIDFEPPKVRICIIIHIWTKIV